MAQWPEVPPEKLKLTVDPNGFPFQTTEEVVPLEGIIGQERATRAMEFGLRIDKHGYNIFVTGLTGLGKLSYTKWIVGEVAKEKPVPEDWVYVYNFENPSKPRALHLPAGLGRALCQDMSELVEELKREIPKAFSGEDYEKQKDALIKEFQEKNSKLIEELNEMAAAQGFTLKRTSTGFLTIPLVEGRPITQEEYEALDQEVKEELERKSTQIQLKAMEIMRRVQRLEKETREKVKELESRIGLFAVGHLIDALKEKYSSFPEVTAYLTDVEQDILANLETFRGEEEQTPPFPWARKMREGALLKYRVNLFVDNRDLKGAPVVIETNPTYYNLVGRIDYENEWGLITTDFTMIKPGALHRANGGYLILQAKDVLQNPLSWEALKRVLKTKEIRIENIGEQYGLFTMATIKPHPIPLSVKVILIGNPLLYHLLYFYDEDFQKLFKIKCDFDTDMKRTEENVYQLAQFISSYCRQEGIRHFDRTAVAKVVEYSCRLAEHQNKLTTRFNEIAEILCEADTWAALDGSKYVTGDHVKKAIEERIYRSNRYEEKLQELYGDGTILLHTSGAVVGQVNGLSVIDLGDYSFGRPSRITTTTCLGEKGVVNIEREIRMSGRIHSKGVLILSGYLGEKYAQDYPLNLSASLTFEQTYEEIEGDSASSAELYALLSSLSGLPIRQDIAVTGSVNQKGEIQPVGGVTAKIEGFFKVCQLQGLTGSQGVIIPYQNMDNLMLSDEVVEAVRQGMFHIYPVRTVDEGISILTGWPAGERQPDGSYPPDTVHGLVSRKLEEYNKKLAILAEELSDKEKRAGRARARREAKKENRNNEEKGITQKRG